MLRVSCTVLTLLPCLLHLLSLGESLSDMVMVEDTDLSEDLGFFD